MDHEIRDHETYNAEQGPGVGVATVLAAALLVVAGVFKLGGWMNPAFAGWGYAASLPYIVGALELIAGAGLLLRRFAGWAALLAGIVMIGALGHHLLRGEFGLALAPLAVLAVLGWIIARRGLTAEATTAGHHVASELNSGMSG